MTTASFISRIIDHGLKPPKALTLMITRDCNLGCRHCLVDSRPAAGAGPVSTGIISSKVKEFASLRGERLILTGGEILTHPDWLEIVGFTLKNTGLSVCLQTNALLITPKVVDRIQALPTDRLSFQVSLEGAEADVHDFIRGPGSFKGAIKGLELLVSAGLGRQTKAAFTETNQNFGDLPKTIELVVKLGLSGLVSGTLVKSGRARNSDHLNLPSPDQYEKLLQKYLTDTDFRELYDQYANISAIEWYKGRHTPGPDGCGCIGELYLTARGLLHPCPMFLHPAYAAEDAHIRPLGEVISRALPLWAELPRINRKRKSSLAPCRTCPGREHCKGGCLGRAFAAHGGLFTVEDRCLLRRVVYGMAGDNK